MVGFDDLKVLSNLNDSMILLPLLTKNFPCTYHRIILLTKYFKQFHTIFFLLRGAAEGTGIV